MYRAPPEVEGDTSASEAACSDGLLCISRLLQALGEAAYDSNKYYFAALALREEGYGLLNTWTAHYPRGQPADLRQQLEWLKPAARMFETMKRKDMDVSSNRLEQMLKRAFYLEKGLVGIAGKAPAAAPTIDSRGVAMSVEAAQAPFQPDKLATLQRAQVQAVQQQQRGSISRAQASPMDKIFAQYGITEETMDMFLWLIQEQQALERYEMGSFPQIVEMLMSSNAEKERTAVRATAAAAEEEEERPRVTLTMPGSWRAAVSSEKRQAVVAAVHAFFTERNVMAGIKSMEDYHNKLRIFEIALLTLCDSAEEYLDAGTVVRRLPSIFETFERYALDKRAKRCAHRAQLEAQQQARQQAQKARLQAQSVGTPLLNPANKPVAAPAATPAV